MSVVQSAIELRNDWLSARVDPLGAQLLALDHAEAGPLLWNGDPAYWTGRAPILFPVIGCLKGGIYRHGGCNYTMPKHGFARNSVFDASAPTANTATFTLQPNAQTVASYPFDFSLQITFAIEVQTLSVTALIVNRGDKPMPMSFGFHPALRWPLPFGGTRGAHRIVFAEPEPAPVRRINGDGLLLPDAEPTPVRGNVLCPVDAMFEPDALIFDDVRSRSVLFGVPDRPKVRVEFGDFPIMGVWTKPGAPFLCIEPWQGLPDPVGFEGELDDKPGVVAIAPQSSQSFTMRISVEQS